MQDCKTLIESLLDRNTLIMTYPELVDICESNSAGILLSNIFHWHKEIGFCKTDYEFAHELRMGHHQFRAAKKQLVDKEYIKVTLKGVPATSYYEFNELLVTKELEKKIGA